MRDVEFKEIIKLLTKISDSLASIEYDLDCIKRTKKSWF